MGDIPHRDNDPIMRLSVHYFSAADVMRQNFKKLQRESTSKGKLSRAKRFDYFLYLRVWIGFLYVVVEGFEELPIGETIIEHGGLFLDLTESYENICRLSVLHKNSLRLFRNAIFHYQRDPAKILQFLEPNVGRIEWAEELHGQLAQFFSQYRIKRTVVYALQKGEYLP
jgi:hypothetical protein